MIYVVDILLCVMAYLLGSVPFGLVLTKGAGLGDIRAIGSGNIGATNVLRTGRKDLALATLVLDGMKGGIAVWLASLAVYYGMGHFDVIPLAGVCAVLGHVFPVWLRFKGGKGVITSFVVFLVLDWSFGVFICVIWLCVFFLSRISSLAAIVSMLVAIVASYIVYEGTLFSLVVTGVGVLVLVKHHSNIRRLLRREEGRSSFK